MGDAGYDNMAGVGWADTVNRSQKLVSIETIVPVVAVFCWHSHVDWRVRLQVNLS